MRHRTVWAASIAMAFSLVDCAGPSDRTTGTVGPGGGVVTVTDGALRGVSITVPPGALGQTITLTIEPGADSTGLPPGVEPAGPVVRFGPEGQQFNLPVTLTLPTTLAATGTYTRPTGGGSAWTAIADVTVDNAQRVVLVRVNHFSEFIPTTDAMAQRDGGLDASTMDGGVDAGRDERADDDADSDALVDVAPPPADVASDVTPTGDAGSCGPSCSGPVTCVDGMCCDNWHLGARVCDGVCANVKSDPHNCGMCGYDCGPNAGCATGTCVCEDGVIGRCADHDGGVDAGGEASADAAVADAGHAPSSAPRPIVPASGLPVATRRPVLQWALASGTEGAHVEICSDRACAHALATFDVLGTGATVPIDLPYGVAYWRLHARHAGTTLSDVSATWQFAVRRSAGGRAPGMPLDINGDGNPDLVVSDVPGSGPPNPVAVYLGTSMGFPTTPTTRWAPGPMVSYGSNFAANVGDVNGDGYDDIAIQQTGAWQVAIYYGSAAGAPSSPGITLTAPDTMSNGFGSSLAPAGDVNGDGYADVLVASVGGTTTMSGRVFLYLGGRSGLATSPAIVWNGAASNDYYGGVLDGVGDLNGDGYDDVAIAGGTGPQGHTEIYLGGPLGSSMTPSVSWAMGAYGIAGVGDVNGDGYDDVMLAVRSVDPAYASLYFGGPTIATTPAALLRQPPPSSSSGDVLIFGTAVHRAGDLNGDGFDDVVIPDSDVRPDGPEILVYPGGPSGPHDPAAIAVLRPPGDVSTSFCQAGAATGDIDHDGLMDLAIGAPGGDSRSAIGTVYLYGGSITGLAAIPYDTLRAGTGGFGAGLAGR